MRKLLYIFFAFAGLISSCHKNYNFFEADFNMADSLMFISPSEALKILEKYSSLTDKMQDEDKARYALLLTQAMIRNNIKLDSDSQINIAVDYYSKHFNKERLAWSYLYHSNIHQRLGNDSIALFSVRKANNLASEIDNVRLKYYIHVFWSNIVKYRSPYTDGLKQFESANKYATLCADTLGMIWSLDGIASSLVYMKEFAEAREVFMKEKNLSIRMNEIGKINGICNGIAFTYYMQDSLSSANKMLDEALLWSRKSGSDSSYSYELKRGLLIQMGKFDDALKYLIEPSNRSDFRRYASYCYDMSRIEEGRGNIKNALIFYKTYAEYLDSLYSQEMADKVLEWQKKYDLLDVEAERDREKAHSLGVWLIVAVLVIVILILLFLFVCKIRQKNVEIKLATLAKDKAMSESVEQMQSRVNKLLRSHIDNENKLKKYIYDTNEAINKIRKLRDLEKQERKDDPSGKISLSDDDINGLMMAVDVCHNDFMQRMREEYPQLSKEDLGLICLVKLGLHNRDIAPLLNVSENTLKKRKYRLKRKQLGLSDREADIDEWLQKKELSEKGFAGFSAGASEEEVEEKSAGQEKADGEA